MHEHEDHIHEGEVTHEHTHTHTYEHSHPHTHDHEHSHGEAHTHDHAHPHTHSHEAEVGAPEQTVALLRYMLEHNRSHAAEVEALIPKLVTEGNADAAIMIESGVKSYKDGTDWLAAALKKLEAANT